MSFVLVWVLGMIRYWGLGKVLKLQIENFNSG